MTKLINRCGLALRSEESRMAFSLEFLLNVRSYISIVGWCNILSFCGVRAGHNAHPVQCCSDIYKGPPSLVSDGHGRSVPRELSSLDMKPNVYLLLVLKLTMGRTIRPALRYVSIMCTETNLPLSLFLCKCTCYWKMADPELYVVR